MENKNFETINSLQLAFEILVLIGYIIALIPFGYIFTAWFVIPLAITNLVFSSITQNNTLPFTITNVIMSFLSLIPLLGYLFRIIGIIMSIVSISKISELRK